MDGSSSVKELAARCVTDVSNNVRRSLTSTSPSTLNEPTGTARDLEAQGATEMNLSDDDETTLKDISSGSEHSFLTKQPRTFTSLPNELQLMIIRQLDFTDIQNLRQTCTYFHAFASPPVIRSLFGHDNFRQIVISHCRICLSFLPSPFSRLRTTPKDTGYPLSSRCVSCALQSRDGTVRVGRKIVLGDYVDYWVCRWCGWPITSATANGHVQFHIPCYSRYANVLMMFFCLGWLQLSFGITASALCWKYYRHEPLIFAPATTNFLLMWLCIGVLLFRGSRVRTYHWTLFIEVAIVGLWIAPIWRLVQMGVGSPPDKNFGIVTMIFGNMLSRIVNILGNAVLVFEYDRTKHYIPQPSWWRRLTNPLMSGVIFWTYPQAIEQKPKLGA